MSSDNALKELDSKTFQFTERNKNFVIFNRILKFAKYVCNIYYDPPLYAYINMMEQADVLVDTEPFVNAFKLTFNGKHRAKCGDRAYFNIPKILSLNNRHSPKIKEMFENIKMLYSDIYSSEEYELINDFCNKLVNCRNTDDINPNDIEPNGEGMKTFLTKIKPDIDSVFKNLIKKGMFGDILKIMLINVYDMENVLNEDIEPIRSIIRVLITSLNNIDFASSQQQISGCILKLINENKNVILSEFTKIKDSSKIMNVFSQVGINNLGAIF